MNVYSCRHNYLDAEKKNQISSEVLIHDKPDESLQLEPLYNVVLIDDNDHTYDYVIEMLVNLFDHSKMKAFAMACEVDYSGRVIVFTTSKDEACRKRDQIHAYGPDWRLERSKGPMSSVVEPCE